DGVLADAALVSGPASWLVVAVVLGSSVAMGGPWAVRASARRAARRSALARALSFSFISRSRFANEGRWLLIRHLVHWKVCERRACARVAEPHGSAGHGWTSPDSSPRWPSRRASRALPCCPLRAGSDFQRPRARTRSSSAPCFGRRIRRSA